MGKIKSKVWSHFIQSVLPNWFVCKYCEKIYKKNSIEHLKICRKVPQNIKKQFMINKGDCDPDDMDKSDVDENDEFSVPSCSKKLHEVSNTQTVSFIIILIFMF